MTTAPAPVVYVSPSQINNWLGCRRKWAFSRVRDRFDTEYTRFGTAVHDYKEQWLLHGTPPDPNTKEGRAALAGLPFLPVPGSCELATEVAIKQELLGVPYNSRLDLIFDYKQNECVTVWDHKTCGRVDWAKTPEQLQFDPQWIVYGYWASITCEVPLVHGVWGYVQRDAKRAAQVRISNTREELAWKMGELNRRVSLPILAHHGVPPLDLPPDLRECYKYGTRNPCEHLAECHSALTFQERLAAASLSKAKTV